MYLESTNNYSLEEALNFQDYGAKRGLFNGHTASSRKGAMATVFRWLSDEEKADIRKVDIDAEIQKWINRDSNKYTPASMSVYQSRVRAGVAEFLRYRESPATYKPKPASSLKPAAKKPSFISTPTPGRATAADFPAAKPSSGDIFVHGLGAGNALVCSVPVRPGVMATLSLGGLPKDLSAAEAERTANLIATLIAPLLTASVGGRNQ